MSRFVVIFHQVNPESSRADHYDLMIECPSEFAGNAGKPLITWELPEPLRAGIVDAKRLANHRREYLDYEGDLSGARGTVSRVLGGDATWVSIGGDEMEVRLTAGAVRWLIKFCKLPEQRYRLDIALLEQIA